MGLDVKDGRGLRGLRDDYRLSLVHRKSIRKDLPPCSYECVWLDRVGSVLMCPALPPDRKMRRRITVLSRMSESLFTDSGSGIGVDVK